MTEPQWLVRAKPECLLYRLGERLSGRKARLFAAACYRLIWPLLSYALSRQARKAPLPSGWPSLN